MMLFQCDLEMSLFQGFQIVYENCKGYDHKHSSKPDTHESKTFVYWQKDLVKCKLYRVCRYLHVTILYQEKEIDLEYIHFDLEASITICTPFDDSCSYLLR